MDEDKIEKNRIGYMDKIDFDHEMDHGTLGGRTIYSTEEECRENLCGDCGIVKVKVSLMGVIEETTS